MAEVVEVNIVCKVALDLDIVRKFIHKEIDEWYGKEFIEVMDDWEYDNLCEIASEDIWDCLKKNKIVCITEKTNDGTIGISIEKKESYFCYTVWFNLERYDNSVEYDNLCSSVLQFLKKEINTNLIICSIGKEVIFEYQSDYESLLKKSHGIDIWVNLDIELTDIVLEKYEIINIEKFVVLKKK